MGKGNRSWLGLITFCTATTLGAGLALGMVFASGTVVFAVAQSLKPTRQAASSEDVPARTFSGMITDAHCGAKHKLADKSPAECARLCVKNGSRYVLVNGEKIYALSGDTAAIGRLAGQRVTIAGSIEGNTINISSANAGQ